MSDKTFLQELNDIKNKIWNLSNAMVNDDNCRGYYKDLEDLKDAVQAMINQCIEIQLMMTKQENAKKFYNTKDF